MYQELNLKIQLDNIQRVCTGQRHNAFGDAVIFQDQLFISYRSGTHHMSDDGKIIVVQCKLNGQRVSYHQLVLPGYDLRDPHFTPTQSGKLMLIAHTRSSPAHPVPETVSWFSTGNNTWSGIHFPGPRAWWLWRAKEHNGMCWGLGYLRQANQLNLYAGQLRGQMELKREAILSKKKHGLGYPNESDLVFTSDDRLITIVRRDADSYTAQLGISKPPYTQFKWQDLKMYIGGPAMLLLNDDSALVAGRHWDGKNLHTRLWQLNITTAKLTTLAVLPSAGDNGYPGLAIHNDRLLMTYYSSHIDNQSRMYLATFSVDQTRDS